MVVTSHSEEPNAETLAATIVAVSQNDKNLQKWINPLDPAEAPIVVVEEVVEDVVARFIPAALNSGPRQLKVAEVGEVIFKTVLLPFAVEEVMLLLALPRQEVTFLLEVGEEIEVGEVGAEEVLEEADQITRQ